MNAIAIYPATQTSESKLPNEDDSSDAAGSKYSVQMLQRVQGGLVAALVGKLAAHTCGMLQQMGHQPVAFARASDLLAALKNGQHLDLVLLSLQDECEAVGKGKFAMFEALGLPALLLVQRKEWEDLSSQTENLTLCEILEFDALRTTNEELSWRAHAAVRRMRDIAQKQSSTSARRSFGGYRFVGASLSVAYRGHEVVLQPRQYEFAFELFKNFGCVLTRERLWSSLWKSAPRNKGARVIDACAANVRRKLQLHGENGIILRSVYGEGYQLVSTGPSALKAPWDITL